MSEEFEAEIRNTFEKARKTNPKRTDFDEATQTVVRIIDVLHNKSGGVDSLSKVRDAFKRLLLAKTPEEASRVRQEIDNEGWWREFDLQSGDELDALGQRVEEEYGWEDDDAYIVRMARIDLPQGAPRRSPVRPLMEALAPVWRLYTGQRGAISHEYDTTKLAGPYLDLVKLCCSELGINVSDNTIYHVSRNSDRSGPLMVDLSAGSGFANIVDEKANPVTQ